MEYIDLGAFERAPLVKDPFDHMIVPGFVPPAVASTVRAGFPDIRCGGLVPVSSSGYGEDFTHLMAALRSDRVREAFQDKFGVELDPLSLLVTIRGRCRRFDGQIHTDSESKLLTVLIYLDDDWRAEGGRLRLLRSAEDIEDVIAEVPPMPGTLVAFRRTDNSFHGHKPYEGIRRVIMLNWMVDAKAAARERRRHAISARMKRLMPMGFDMDAGQVA